MEFFKRLQEINREGWFLTNCFQLPAAELFRVNLQFKTPNGAATEYFSAFADAEDPVEALEAAFFNTKASGAPTGKVGTLFAPKTRKTPDVISPAQEKRLIKALEANYLAVKLSGSRSRN